MASIFFGVASVVVGFLVARRQERALETPAGRDVVRIIWTAMGWLCIGLGITEVVKFIGS